MSCLTVYIFIMEYKWCKGTSHVPFYIVGKHAQKDVGLYMVGGA